MTASAPLPPRSPPPAYPFNLDAPNRDRAIDEVMPIVCTLLFGFAGAFFATAAAADKGETVLGLLVLRNPLTGAVWYSDFRKGYVLFITGVAAISFYVSLISIIYSRMKDPLPAWRHVGYLNSGLTDEHRRDRDILKKFLSERRRYRVVSLNAFNFGILFIPFAGLLFLKQIVLPIALVLYALFFLVAMYRVAQRFDPSQLELEFQAALEGRF